MINRFELQFPILSRLQDSCGQISETDLRSFELELLGPLPEEYFRFLLTYNAAWANHPISFQVQNPSRYVEGGTIESTLGVFDDHGEPQHSYSLRWGLDTYEGLIGEGWIPIMYSGSDLVCIALIGDDYGRVLFWDSEDDPADKNRFVIADTFMEFLAGLTIGDESYLYVEELPTFQAVERGLMEVVREYLADQGKVDLRNAANQTLLMCAARTSWPNLVELLLSHGADVHAIDRKGYTPVVHAALGQSIDSLKLLLDAGGDPCYTDQRGRSLVESTKRRYYFRVSQFLAKKLAEESGL